MRGKRRTPQPELHRFNGVWLMIAGLGLSFVIGDRALGVAMLLRWTVGELGWVIPGAMILLGLSWTVAPSAGRMVGALACSTWFAISATCFFRNEAAVGHFTRWLARPLGEHFPLFIGVICVAVAFFHLEPFFTGPGRRSVEAFFAWRIELPMFAFPSVPWGRARKPEITRVAKPGVSEARDAGVSAPQGYQYPPLSILAPQVPAPRQQCKADLLLQYLATQGVSAVLKSKLESPIGRSYTLQLPTNVKLAKLQGMQDDIAMNISVPSARVVRDGPTSPFVRIETQNAIQPKIGLREVLEASPVKRGSKGLRLALGRDIKGNPLTKDLTQFPHLLIAGATGSGKTVMLHSIISSLVMDYTPDDVKFVLIDPAMVGLSKYRDIPHLMAPVVTDKTQAGAVLSGIVIEMERRLKVLLAADNENIDEYNQGKSAKAKMPYLVVVSDEMNAMILCDKKGVEPPLIRLTAEGRKTGIHVILATQRPTRETVHGQIDINVTGRICFAVPDHEQSLVVLGETGGEDLRGNGDGLFQESGCVPIRFQASFVEKAEIAAMTSCVKSNGPAPSPPVETYVPPSPATDTHQPEPPQIIDVTPRVAGGTAKGSSARSAQVRSVVEWIGSKESVAVRPLREFLGCSPAHAMEVLEELESLGIVGPKNGNKPRLVLGVVA